jgi:hypothetical protein
LSCTSGGLYPALPLSFSSSLLDLSFRLICLQEGRRPWNTHQPLYNLVMIDNVMFCRHLTTTKPLPPRPDSASSHISQWRLTPLAKKEVISCCKQIVTYLCFLWDSFMMCIKSIHYCPVHQVDYPALPPPLFSSAIIYLYIL